MQFVTKLREVPHAFPEPNDVSVTHAWDGLVSYRYDETPCRPRTSSGIHYALGYRGTDVSRAIGAKWELSRQAASLQKLGSVQ
jgi:hypothetical protein